VAAAATARQLGVEWDAVARGLSSVHAVRGRFEAVDEGQPFTVVVDFAHTPAALAEALKAARELAGAERGRPAGKVLLVFGAGGDRDRSKRPALGRVAAELADVVVVTTDNPRSEKPLAIIEEIASGIEGGPPLVDIDRASAISGAVTMARPGDVVVIAGKGHETGQDFGDRVAPFDDVEQARAALAQLGWGRGRGTGGEGE
jgi:UDP-N-acetylmuramoyl-L-alanyl-D-glutamate--2,6-diaminopimelate ligase